MPQLQSLNSTVVFQLGNRGEYPRCELGRKQWRLHALSSWIRSITWSVIVATQVPMVQTVQMLGQGPPLPSNDKVVDIPIVTKRQIPKVQTSRRRQRFRSCSTTTRWSMSLLCRSCWFPFESLGTCTSSQGGPGEHCGSDGDRSASACRICAIHVRHGTRLGVSSSCCGAGTPAPVVGYAELQPLVMYVHAHCHRGRPVLVSVVLLWHAQRFVRYASRLDVLAVGYGINAGADCWKVKNSC